jgi:transcriptional regulator with XRE-family HTH domain
MLSGRDITDVIECPAMEPGNIIKDERVRRDWSQAELGKRVGISQVAIKKIEAGKTRKSKHLARIAQELEIPLSKLDPSLSRNRDGNDFQPDGVASRVRNQALKTIPAADLMGDVDSAGLFDCAGRQGGTCLGK